MSGVLEDHEMAVSTWNQPLAWSSRRRKAHVKTEDREVL
jgi:hypothetical protein